ncbi:hypothetical protein OROGR_017155 [Orobanche gracilis]
MVYPDLQRAVPISNCGFRPGFAIPAAGRSSGQIKDVKRSGLKSLPLDVENPGGDNSRLIELLRLWTDIRRKRC